MFTTDRLHFRGSMLSDADNLLQLYNDIRIAPWITEEYVVPRQHKYIDTINSFIDKCEMSCIIVERKGDAFVGMVGIVGPVSPKNRSATICIALMPTMWGKGYGKETLNFIIGHAFDSMGMHRVTLTVIEGNDRARALYRKIGFQDDGKQRKSIWMSGCWKDLYHMSILEDEWPEIKRKNNEGGR